MERITLYIRTRKTSGKIRIRFRLTDGRRIQLFHKSQIRADLADLKKFNLDGTVKLRVTKHNEELRLSIACEMETMLQAYKSLDDGNHPKITSKNFERRIAAILSEGKIEPSLPNNAESLYERFIRFMDSLKEYQVVSSSRLVTYSTVKDKLRRYLDIFGKTAYAPSEFTANDILKFREFIMNEHLYVDKYPHIYKGLDKRSTPTKAMNQNSAVLKMRVLSTFFSELENNEEITRSPFRRLSKTQRREMMREQYDEPFALTGDELLIVMNTKVPEDLKETKDAFLLQCALGCRIGDFIKLDMENMTVSDDGIPYVHYIASKTSKTISGRKEKATPLMLFALEIAKRTGFKFVIFKTQGRKGQVAYNENIKKLLKHCGINRQVGKYCELEKKMKFFPVHELATSKLCRKTHIDIASKIQINMYATGLHEAGSEAVGHYSKLQLQDLFQLLCLAFSQPQYRVDRSLNIIREHGLPS